MSIKQLTEVIEAVRANGGYIVDDDAPVNVAFKPSCLAVMRDQDGECVVPIFHSWKFPKTPIYIGADGVPHMSQKDSRILSSEKIEMFDLAGYEMDVSLVVEI